VIQHHRVKYACPCCDESIRVTRRARVIAKGLLTESALAWVVTAKYQDALPLYRQAALLSRFGGDLSRNTLAASMVRVGEAVQPIINLLRDICSMPIWCWATRPSFRSSRNPRSAQSKATYGADDGFRAADRLFTYAPGRGKQACPSMKASNPARY